MSIRDVLRKTVSQRFKIPYKEVSKMSDEQIKQLIREKTGNMKWPEGTTVDGYPIKSMEDINEWIDEVAKRVAEREKEQEER